MESKCKQYGIDVEPIRNQCGTNMQQYATKIKPMQNQYGINEEPI